MPSSPDENPVKLPTISVTIDNGPPKSQNLGADASLGAGLRPPTSSRFNAQIQHTEMTAFTLGSSETSSVLVIQEPIGATKLESPVSDTGINDDDENVGDFFAEDNEVESYHPLCHQGLRRSPSQQSFVSTRTTRSAATVISHGVLRLLISDICDLIRTRRSLHRAEVVSTECYCRRRGAIFHRFLILELRRAGRKDLWLRIDRRRDRYHPKLQFLTTLSTPANDLARMASRRETLLSDSDTLENRQMFERNPKLPQLEALLREMIAELPTYELLSANCWFYTSFLQEYLGANGNRGYFTTGGAIRMELAASLRTRIRQALQRYERVESKDSRRTSGSSLSRVKSLEMVSSLQTPQTAYGTLSGLAPAYPQSGAEYNQLGALNDADRISPSTSASQIFDQFQALNRDIREFCDDVAERIGVSYTLPSDETFCQCHPVWKAMRGFQTSEDYIYFCLLSIMSSQIYDQIFTPFHPASTDEENRSQSLEYERRLKTESPADSGSWHCMRFRSIDATISEMRVTELVQKINSSIESSLQHALRLGTSEKIPLDPFTARLDVTLRAAYAWNRTAKREAEKYACAPYLVRPGTRWDPSRMESFERLYVPVSHGSKIISPVSLGLIANVTHSGEYASHVQLKAHVLVEEWFHKPKPKPRPLQDPRISPVPNRKGSGFWPGRKNAGSHA